jgi:hypothetical protein
MGKLKLIEMGQTPKTTLAKPSKISRTECARQWTEGWKSPMSNFLKNMVASLDPT